MPAEWKIREHKRLQEAHEKAQALRARMEGRGKPAQAGRGLSRRVKVGLGVGAGALAVGGAAGFGGGLGQRVAPARREKEKEPMAKGLVAVPISKAFATRDQNSSIGTTVTRRQGSGPYRKSSLAAVARGQESGHAVGQRSRVDANSTPRVIHVQPRSPKGKFVASANELKVHKPKYRQSPKKPHDTFLGHYTKGGDKASKEFLGKADTGMVRSGRRIA